jgi:hypothetical protein
MTGQVRAATALVARSRRPAVSGLAPIAPAAPATAATPAAPVFAAAGAGAVSLAGAPAVSTASPPAHSASAAAPPAPSGPSRPVASPLPAWAARAVPAGSPPRHDDARTMSAPVGAPPGVSAAPFGAPLGVPALPFQTPAGGAASLSAVVHPLLERTRRSVRPAIDQSAVAIVGTTVASTPQPAVSPAAEPRVQQPSRPRAEPAHPPVSIGEIHVHVTEPAPAAADPLALLTPYGHGLTARRGGSR